jgi:phage recombination protein Bet
MKSKVSKEEIALAISQYIADPKHHGIQSTYDDANDTYLLKDANGKEITIGSGWKCSDDVVKQELADIIMNARDAKDGVVESNLKPIKRVEATIASTRSRNNATVSLAKPREIQSLTYDEIRQFTGCLDASDPEVQLFVEICWRRNLNFFAGDAFLVKYGGKTPKASIIVSKDAFFKKAELNPQYDGIESGLITGEGEEIPGSFYKGKKEEILGAWAKVYRKDRKVPSFVRVSMSEFRGQSHFWDTKPGIMIEKCAQVKALRQAFPTDLGGLYEGAEMDIDPSKEV